MQRLRRLSRRRGSRREEHRFLIDGPVLLDEALRAGTELEAVYSEPDADREVLQRVVRAGLEPIAVAAGSLAKVLDVVNPRSLVAVAHLRPVGLANVLAAAAEAHRPVLGLVGIQDPGNAGTLLRVCEATGCAGVVLTAGSVDPWNPKVVRGSAGSILRVAVADGPEPQDLLEAAQRAALAVVATVGTGGEAPDALDLTGASLLLVGAEAHGLAPEVVAAADVRTSIPMEGGVESLNAAVAGSVVAFEASRQRRMTEAARSGETESRVAPPGGPQ